ncbi:MAG: peptidase M28, partial [Sphingomonadaceae bacterium]
MRKLILAAALFTTPAVAQDTPADNVSADRLKEDVEKLVSFGTRHTLSEQDDPTRGIGAAVDWGAAEFQRIATACG